MVFVWLLVGIVLRVRLRWFCSVCTAREVTLSGFWFDIGFGCPSSWLIVFACCLLLVGFGGFVGVVGGLVRFEVR